MQDGCFVIIGTDIPKLDLKAIAYAFKQLKTSNVVIGPTYDGGFWLIGFSGKRRHVNPFDNISKFFGLPSANEKLNKQNSSEN